MKISFQNIIPIESGITNEMLFRYLTDSASRTESRLIDRAIEQDDIFADAVEGLMQLPTKELEAIFENLDSKILEKTTQNSENTEGVFFELKIKNEELRETNLTVVHRRPNRFIWWAAASVATLFGAAIWLFTKPTPTAQDIANQSVVEELPTLQPTEIKSLDTTLATLPTPQYPPFSKGKTDAQTVINASDIAATPVFESDKSHFSDTNLAAAPSAPAAETAEPIAVQNAPRPIATEAKERPAPKIKDDNTRVAEGKIPAKIDLTDRQDANYNAEGLPMKTEELAQNRRASRVYEAEKQTENSDKVANASKPRVAAKKEQVKVDPTTVYSGASAQNMAVPQPYSPPSVKTTFLQGEKQYNQKNYAEAVFSLNQVLNTEKKGELYEKASWLLANSYINLNRKNEARTLLNRIISEKGTYSESAKTLILKLGN